MVQCELYTTPKAALRFQGIKTQVSRVPKNLVAKECADWCANYLAGSSVSKESAFYPVFAVLYQTQFSAMIRKNITSYYRCAIWYGQFLLFGKHWGNIICLLQYPARRQAILCVISYRKDLGFAPSNNAIQIFSSQHLKLKCKQNINKVVTLSRPKIKNTLFWFEELSTSFFLCKVYFTSVIFSYL